MKAYGGCEGRGAAKEEREEGISGKRGMRLASGVRVGVACVLVLAAGHCLAGLAVYGSTRRGALLQVGSLKLSGASPVLVQQAVEESWQQAVIPARRTLEREGEAMLAEIQATHHLKKQV